MLLFEFLGLNGQFRDSMEKGTLGIEKWQFVLKLGFFEKTNTKRTLIFTLKTIELFVVASLAVRYVEKNSRQIG